MDFTADLPLMLADFGQAGTLDGQAVVGIFESPQAFGNVGLIGATAQEPSYLLATGSVPSGVVGKVLVTGGVSWRVRQAGADEPGLTRLMLERQL